MTRPTSSSRTIPSRLDRDAARSAGADGVGVHRPVHVAAAPRRPLDAAQIAAMDPDEFLAVCKGPPAIHRFPGSMGKRVQALAQRIVDDYGGDAEASGATSSPATNCSPRLLALPATATRRRASSSRCSPSASACSRTDGRKRPGRSPTTRRDPSRTSTRRSRSHAYASGSRRGKRRARRKPTDFRRVNSRAPSRARRGLR